MSSLFGLFSGEKKKEEAVEFDRFGDWFRNELEDMDGFAWSNVEGRYSEIEGSVEDLDETLDRFKGQDLPEEIAPRLKNMAESNRKVLIGQLQSFIDTFQVPDESGYADVYEFLKDKSSEIDKVSEKIKKSLMVLDKVQSEETSKIVSRMKEVEEKLDIEDDLEKTISILERYDKARKTREELKDAEMRFENLESELEEELRVREELSQKLMEVEESEESEKIKRRERDLGRKEDEIRKMEDRIRGEIAPLKRGLKKLKYFGTSTDDEKLLDMYISSPLEATRRDDDLSFLQEVVVELKEKLSSDGLDFSDEESERIKEELQDFDLGYISETLGELDELEERRGDIEDEILELDSEDIKEEIRKDLERKKEEIENLRGKIEKTERRIEDLEESLEKSSQKIEDKVEDILNIDLELEGIKP